MKVTKGNCKSILIIYEDEHKRDSRLRFLLIPSKGRVILSQRFPFSRGGPRSPLADAKSSKTSWIKWIWLSFNSELCYYSYFLRSFWHSLNWTQHRWATDTLQIIYKKQLVPQDKEGSLIILGMNRQWLEWMERDWRLETMKGTENVYKVITAYCVWIFAHFYYSQHKFLTSLTGNIWVLIKQKTC